MAEDQNVLFLGKGVGYPIQLDALTKVVLNEGIRAVQEGLVQLLGTPRGTRFFLNDWGSRLNELVYEQNDTVLEDLSRLFIFEAINKYEKRVKFVRVDFIRPEEQEDLLEMHISVRLLASNEIFSFVYPFYRKLKF